MSRILRVFEYDTVHVTGGAEGAAGLTATEFEALVRFNDEHGRRYFSVGHRAITFCQFVGYLQVGSLGIEVLPKADRRAADSGSVTAWRDVLLEMLRIAHGIDLHSPGAAWQATRRSTLLELVVASFVRETETIARHGLAKSYRAEEANGPTLRGRLLFQEQVRHNHSRADRCYVRFTSYDRDIPVNRLLRAALDVSEQSPVPPVLRARVLACRPAFDAVNRAAVRPGMFDRIAFTRTTERYRKALTLARMLVECMVPALRVGKTPVFALLFDINILWERFVAALFQKARPTTVSVTAQAACDFYREPDQRPRRLRPDIVLRRAGNVVAIVDTKWKLLDSGGPSDGDLQQMFAYNEMFGAPQAILVYPGAAGGGYRRRGAFGDARHRCAAFELDPVLGGTPGALQAVRGLVESIQESDGGTIGSVA